VFDAGSCGRGFLQQVRLPGSQLAHGL